MAIWTSFRKARHYLLRENGELLTPDGRQAGKVAGARLIVLSRALCRLEHYQIPQGLNRASAARAARLHAEARAPFAAADWIIYRAGDGYGIWWWDSDRVRALIDHRWRYDPDRIAPETVLQPPLASGWRQVRTADGYEAQFWQAGALRASRWSRQPFAGREWRLLGLGMDAGELPPDAPSPETLPHQAMVIGWSRSRSSPARAWDLTTRWAAGAASVALVAASFFTGQALRYQSSQAKDLAAAEASQEAELADPATARSLASLELVRAFRVRMPAPTPLAAAAEGIGILHRFGLTAAAWSVDARVFRARLVLPDHGFSMRSVAESLEASPVFRNVAPQIDAANMSITILADLEGAARPEAGRESSAND